PSDPSSVDTAAGFHYSFACDGNAASLATTYAGAGTSTSTSCSFADQGTFTVRGRIFDKDNGSNTFSTSVVVTNANPVVTAPANQNASEGSSASFSLGSFSDAGVNDSQWLVDVNWGDGSSHTNFSNGAYTVRARIIDKDGGFSEYQTTVTVNNVAPTATFNAPASVNEGQAIGLSLTSSFDPSSVDTAAGFQYAFDCGDGSGYGAFSGTSSTSCPTTDSGS